MARLINLVESGNNKLLDEAELIPVFIMNGLKNRMTIEIIPQESSSLINFYNKAKTSERSYN